MGSHSTGGINHFLLQLEALRTPTAQPQMWPYSPSSQVLEAFLGPDTKVPLGLDPASRKSGLSPPGGELPRLQAPG